MRVRVSDFAIGFIATALAAELAFAQAGWREALPDLTSGDIERLQQVARQEMSGKPVGTSLPWRNGETGAAGTVELADLFQLDGRECRTLNHIIETRHGGRWRNTNTICRAKDGQDWLSAPPRRR